MQKSAVLAVFTISRLIFMKAAIILIVLRQQRYIDFYLIILNFQKLIYSKVSIIWKHKISGYDDEAEIYYDLRHIPIRDSEHIGTLEARKQWDFWIMYKIPEDLSR